MSQQDSTRSEIVRAVQRDRICEMSGNYGPWMEPLACAYRLGHLGEHSFASLPTWANGVQVSPVGPRPPAETGIVPEWFKAGKLSPPVTPYSKEKK